MLPSIRKSNGRIFFNIKIFTRVSYTLALRVRLLFPAFAECFGVFSQPSCQPPCQPPCQPSCQPPCQPSSTPVPMSLHQYFRPWAGLSDSRGSLSAAIPSGAIALANKEVEAALRSQGSGSRTALTWKWKQHYAHKEVEGSQGSGNSTTLTRREETWSVREVGFTAENSASRINSNQP